MKVALAAGGTGGHIFPALAVADAFAARGVEVMIIGIGRELEDKLISQAGYEHHSIPFVAVKGGGVIGLLRSFFAFPAALLKALRLYKEHDVVAVVGFGGYPSFVPMLAAWLSRRMRVLHEQNVQVGLANKFLSLFAKEIYSVEGAHGFWSSKSVNEVGNPVRKVFLDIPKWEAPASGQAFRLLVVGGSQGAVAINNAIIECTELLKEHQIELVHQTGEYGLKTAKDAYGAAGYQPHRLIPFIEDIADEYKAAHLVISRAGAMSVAEVSASSRPAIFIPLRIAGAHQKGNISGLLESSASWILEESDELAAGLATLLEELLSEKSKIEQAARHLEEFSEQHGRHAAELIADSVLE